MSKRKELAPLHEAELAALDPLETPDAMETGLQILNIVAAAYRDLDEEGAAALIHAQQRPPKILH